MESRRCSCLGVSREMEEPVFSGTAEVDCESGDGDLGPLRKLGPFGEPEPPFALGRLGT